MSVPFMGILKLHERVSEDTQQDEFCVKLRKLAVQYGYGIKFKRYITLRSTDLKWVNEGIERLGGLDMTLFFEVCTPQGGVAGEIFCVEMQDALDWEDIHFPPFR